MPDKKINPATIAGQTGSNDLSKKIVTPQIQGLSINSTIIPEPSITNKTNLVKSSGAMLGHGASSHNEFVNNSKKRKLLYPIIIITNCLVGYMILSLLYFLPVVGYIMPVLFVRYTFKLLLKSKMPLSLGYSVILSLIVLATVFLVFIGVTAFMPSFYSLWYIVGSVAMVSAGGPVYYLVVYIVLKNVKGIIAKLTSEDPSYGMYELLEATIILLRRISYVGVVGFILIIWVIFLISG